MLSVFSVVLIALVVLAASVLVVMGVRVARLLRTCRGTASMVAASTGDRVGMVRARSAAVRVAVERRRRRSRTPRAAQYDRA